MLCFSLSFQYQCFCFFFALYSLTLRKNVDDIIAKSKILCVLDLEKIFATLRTNQMPLNPKKLCVRYNGVNVWVFWSIKGELTQILINFQV